MQEESGSNGVESPASGATDSGESAVADAGAGDANTPASDSESPPSGSAPPDGAGIRTDNVFGEIWEDMVSDFGESFDALSVAEQADLELAANTIIFTTTALVFESSPEIRAELIRDAEHARGIISNTQAYGELRVKKRLAEAFHKRINQFVALVLAVV